jgi:hypothetical protein
MENNLIYDLSIKDTIKTILDNSNWVDTLTNLQCFEELRRLEEILQRQWVNSNCTDFSIYSSQDYYSNLILCNIFYSSGIVDKCLEYFKAKYNTEFKKMTWYEDYPGFGLTTAKLIGNGITNISVFNDNKDQIYMMQKLLAKLQMKMPTVVDTRESTKYDIVCSFEVAEHFKTPTEYLDKLINSIKPNGFLCYSATYQLHNVKRGFYYTGHYAEYNTPDGVKSDRKDIDLILDKYFIERGLEICHMSEDRRPVIYKKIK